MTITTPFELSPFLRLPPELRQRIYYHLLCPEFEEDITTINYDLSWPYLQNPTSGTFTYHQLDMCSCPAQQDDHIYIRHLCVGPEVTLKLKTDALWILEKPNGPLNILRPATEHELTARPSAGILRVNRLVRHEATPLLYRGRNLRFLTGHCPRGRYQAYATQVLLGRMSAFAQAQITHLSIIYQNHEEDCRWPDVKRSYASFVRFILAFLPRCRTLDILSLWLGAELGPFCKLFERNGMKILVQKNMGDEKIECKSTKEFVACFSAFRKKRWWATLLDAGGSRSIDKILVDSHDLRNNLYDVEISLGGLEDPTSDLKRGEEP